MRKLSFVLAALALSACVGSGESGNRPLRPYEIATDTYRSGGTQSFVGSLMYEGGCLLFEGEKNSARVLPVWPNGTRFEESVVTFHQPAKSDQLVPIAGELRIDGWAADWSRLDPHRFAPFRRQCGGIPFFVSSVAPAN